MKSLKISDISKSYNIGIDSLRYYEKIGLIQPERLENGYRQYNYIDLWKLNVIKELKTLGFPLERIGTYLNNRSTESTINLFIEEIETIDTQIKYLQSLKETIVKKLDVIETFSKSKYQSTITIEKMEKRDCILLMENLDNKEQIDFFFRKLQLKADDKIPLMGHKALCIFMPVNQLHKDNVYSQVFSFYPIQYKENKEYDFSLPEANYLSVTYKGHHDLSRQHALMLTEFAEENNYELLTEPFEICHIDIHETEDREEYVTEIQVAVRKKG